MPGLKFNAGECKVQLKLGISRMQLQKNKKVNTIKNIKREIAKLLGEGRHEGARIKTEVIIREDFLIDSYEILELLAETLVTRIAWLATQEFCPIEMKEAVCTIIYAAPRVEIKELSTARLHLIAKFGKEFGLEASENRNNCVNPRIVHKLRVQPPEQHLVIQYMIDIAKAHNIDWKADDLLREAAIVEPLPTDIMQKDCPVCHGHIGGGEPHHHGGSGGGGGGGGQIVVPEKTNSSIGTTPGSNTDFEKLFASVPSNQNFGSNAAPPSIQGFPSLPSGGIGMSQPQFPPVPSQQSNWSQQEQQYQQQILQYQQQIQQQQQQIQQLQQYQLQLLQSQNTPPPQHQEPQQPSQQAPSAAGFGLAAPGGVPLVVFDKKKNESLNGHSNNDAPDPFSLPSPPSDFDQSINPFTIGNPPISNGAPRPSAAMSLNFPAPPSASDLTGSVDLTTSMPNFDELTARFEALKKGQF